MPTALILLKNNQQLCTVSMHLYLQVTDQQDTQVLLTAHNKTAYL